MGDLRCPLVEGFLVERYWPGVTLDDVGRLNTRLDQASSPVATFVASILVPTDEIVLFAFQAVDDRSVLAMSQQAGLRCDRIVPATHLLGDGGSHLGTKLGP
jgi:hypothetical protein